MRNDKIKEKRGAPRININAQLHYRIRGQAKNIFATSNNISAIGASFNNQEFLPVSTLIMLEINILSHIIKPIGEVVRTLYLPNINYYQTGVRFLEFEIGEKKYLSDLIDSKL